MIELDQSYNAGLFIQNSKAIAEELSCQARIPIVCGGTGLYIKSMLEGLFVSPAIPSSIRNMINTRISDQKLEDLYQELRTIDPEFAARISSADRQRIQRGMEVYYATGKPMSLHWQEQINSQIYRPFRILVEDDRATLYSRIDQRVRTMIDAGLLEEIRDLMDNGYSEELPGMKTLGYKEFIPYLRGERQLEDCINETAQRTRNYAKRQLTWYRKYDFHLTLSPSEFRLSNILVRIQEVLDLT
jgi:tRNA dimethylallyltransferase